MFQLAVNHIVLGAFAAIASSLVGMTTYRTVTLEQDTVVDFIVVGSGSAGSVVASRLSENPNWEVLVLEAGGQPPPESKVPGLSSYGLLSESKYNYDYRVVTQRHALLNYVNQGNFYPRGKVIGGTSTINFMVYFRGNRKDYDRWAGMGNTGWDYDSVLPFFKKMENYKGKHAKKYAKYHGRTGPLSVESMRWDSPFTKYFMAAGKELGLKQVDFNSEYHVGYNSPDLSTINGERHSASDAFLKPNLHRQNLRLQSHSQVIKILINGGRRAVGVMYVHNGKVKKVYARKEVILSAGAIDSPKLLLLSGIGPKEQLRTHGIRSVVDLKGVGQNFQDHPLVAGISYTTQRNAENLIPMMYGGNSQRDYIRNRTGPLSVPFGVVGYFTVNLGVDPDPNVEDTLFLFQSVLMGTDFGLVGVSTYGYTREVFQDYLREQGGRTGFVITVKLNWPKSRGSVSLRSKNPMEAPVIDPNYLSHPDDVEMLLKSIKYALIIGNTTALKDGLGAKLYDKPLLGCKHLKHGSDDYWRCFARRMLSIGYHPSGTCKMAPPSDPDGVVSPRLKVRGVEGLRVIDASIMPLITSSNLNAPTMMIGEKGASMIKEDWGYVE